MPTPPQLTPAQRSAALAKSTAARQVRAAIKARVKAGELSLSAILTLAVNDEAIAQTLVAAGVAAIITDDPKRMVAALKDGRNDDHQR